MRRILLFFIRPYLRFHAQQVLSTAMNPEMTQNRTFSQLKKNLSNSEWARKNGFLDCHKLEELCSLPSTNYENIKTDVSDLKQSEAYASRKILGSKILGFLRTSGSSDEPKDIPMTQNYLKSMDRFLMRMVACAYSSTKSWDQLFSGSQVLLGSRPTLGITKTGLPIADVSGLIVTRTWRSLRWLYIPKHSDLWKRSWNERVLNTIDQSLNKDVRSISGIPALALDFSERASKIAPVSYTHLTLPTIYSV